MPGLDRFSENADDESMSCGSAPYGVIFDRYREFLSIGTRLDADRSGAWRDAKRGRSEFDDVVAAAIGFGARALSMRRRPRFATPSSK